LPALSRKNAGKEIKNVYTKNAGGQKKCTRFFCFIKRDFPEVMPGRYFCQAIKLTVFNVEKFGESINNHKYGSHFFINAKWFL